MNMRILIVAGLFFVVPCVVMAEETAAPEQTAPEQVAAPEQAVEQKSRDLLEEAFEAFAKEHRISYGVPMPGDRFYQTGASTVDADVASPNFVKSRAMAFERALIQATSSMLVDLYGKTSSEKVMHYYGNNSSDADEAPIMQAKGIKAKLSLLTEAKLDKALAEEGVPAEKYQQASVVEKRELLRDAMVIETTKSVIHDCFGCIPIKTFEAHGTDGRYAIGVVIRYDGTSRTLAECFRKKTRPALTKEGGLTIAEVLPAGAEILNNFGVRLYFDESGTPALVSFGQFGSSYTGKSARLAERAEDQAKTQALALADAAMTMFIAGIINSEEIDQVSEDIANTLTFTDDGQVTPQEAARIIDIANKRIRQVGKDQMAGRSTVFNKIVKHPSGHRVAVAVRRWGFDTLDAAKAIGQTKKNDGKKLSVQVKPQDPGVNSGKTFDF